MEYYYVFQCPNCGNYQNKILRNTNLLNLSGKKFKCIRCNKTSAIKKKTAWGLNIKSWGPYNNGMIAAKVCASLKEKNVRQDTAGNN